MAKRKPYTRQNVPPPNKSSATRYKGQAVSKRKTRKSDLKKQSKTFQRESGKIDRSNLWYDDTKKSQLKVKTKSTKVNPKVNPKVKPKVKPKAKAAQNPFDKKKAPKVNKFKKVAKKSWLQKTMERGAKRGEKLNQEKAIRDFNRQVKKTRTPTGQQFKSKTRLPSHDLTKKQLKGAKGTRVIQKGLGISKHGSKLKNLKGILKGGLIYGAADWGANELVDRGFRQLEGKSKSHTMKEYRAYKDAQRKAIRGGKEEYRKFLSDQKNQSQGTGTTPSSTGKTKTSESNKPNSNKSSKGTSKKKFTARDRMRAKNVEIHGEEAISKLEKSHKDWKAARKAGTLKTKRKKKTRPDTWRDVE